LSNFLLMHETLRLHTQCIWLVIGTYVSTTCRCFYTITFHISVIVSLKIWINLLSYKTLRHPIKRTCLMLLALSLRFHAWRFNPIGFTSEWPKLKQPKDFNKNNRGGQAYTDVELATFW